MQVNKEVKNSVFLDLFEQEKYQLSSFRPSTRRWQTLAREISKR